MSSCSLVGVVEDKSVLITVFQCHNQTANCLRSILSFYRPLNASKKPKLWPFEKKSQKRGIFRKITVGSPGMIQTPMFLYSSESWDHEEYFELLQTWKRFQKTQVLTIWKLPQFLVLLPHFFPVPIFCIWFGRRPPSAPTLLCSFLASNVVAPGGRLIIYIITILWR